MYSYEQTEPGLYTVGTYDSGKWMPESNHDSKEEAANRVIELNGGGAIKESQADSIIPIVLDALICAKNTIIALHGSVGLDFYLTKAPEITRINNAIYLCQKKLNS